MKRISVSMLAVVAAIAPAVAAAQSVQDAHPACMERNGPDCVLPSSVVPQRAGPPVVVVPPTVVPPVTPPPVVISPSPTLPPGGKVLSSGIVGSPEPVPPPAPTPPVTSVPPGSVLQPGNSNVIVPSGQGSTIISPRK